MLGAMERFGGWIPDKMYLRLYYLFHNRQLLHLNPPKTFNEKLQWLKLHDRNPLYTRLVDKYEVKDYVSKIIGSQYIVPTLGIWSKPDDIGFDELPNRFVLKTTHDGGGGGVLICNKSDLTTEIVKQWYQKSSAHNIYKTLREWPYKNVTPRIIAEEFIPQFADSRAGLNDYKFFCFNGEPKFCQVKTHGNNKECIDIFDMNWSLLPFSCLNPRHKHAERIPEKPKNFETMVGLARELCVVARFSRVDFYNVDGKIYFGEITFYPASGMGVFTPREYDNIVGRWLNVGE